MITYTEQLDLKKLIKQSKYTQKQLAQRLKMSEQWLGKQLDKPIEGLSIEFIHSICKELGLTIQINVIHL